MSTMAENQFLEPPDQSSDSKLRTIVICKTTLVAVPRSMATFEDRVRVSKWYTRVWTLQKYVLSRRCLIFTRDEYFLHCRKGAHAPTLGTALLRPYDTFGASTIQQRVPSQEDQPKVHRLYARAVSLYLRRDLTCASDILRAFAGILKVLHPCLDNFHFALPIYALPCPLCWMKAASRVQRSGFPSWSWLGRMYQPDTTVERNEDVSSDGVSFPDYD